jgi:hypothetical protein
MASGEERKTSQVARRLPRFTIANLLLITVIASLGVAYVVSNRKWTADVAELQSLRDISGQLTISDPSKIHAIGVPTVGKNKWQWHVYLPVDREFQLHLVTGGVPSHGVPENLGTPQVRSGFYNSGEMLIVAEIAQNPAGDFVLSGSFPKGEFSHPIKNGDWVNRGGHSVVAVEPGHTQVVDPDQPMVLLRMLPDGTTAGGVMVFIDEFK